MFLETQQEEGRLVCYMEGVIFILFLTVSHVLGIINVMNNTKYNKKKFLLSLILSLKHSNL